MCRCLVYCVRGWGYCCCFVCAATAICTITYTPTDTYMDIHTSAHTHTHTSTHPSAHTSTLTHTGTNQWPGANFVCFPDSSNSNNNSKMYLKYGDRERMSKDLKVCGGGVWWLCAGWGCTVVVWWMGEECAVGC